MNVWGEIDIRDHIQGGGSNLFPIIILFLKVLPGGFFPMKGFDIGVFDIFSVLFYLKIF